MTVIGPEFIGGMDIHRLDILNSDTKHSLIRIKKTANIRRNYVSLFKLYHKYN